VEFADIRRLEIDRDHYRRLASQLASEKGLVRDSLLWTEYTIPRDEAELVLGRMEDAGEIARFLGRYRLAG
jgi:hypothetical protein